MIKKVYFDVNKVALGTSEGSEAYYGEYYASEEYDLPDDLLVTGRNATELAAVHRYVYPKYSNTIMEMVRQHLGLEPYDASRDKEINEMSHNTVFTHVLEWEGILGYEYAIPLWIKDIYGVDLS